MISTDFIYGHRFRDLAKAREGFVYVKTDYFDKNVELARERPNEQFTFICHNSDYSITDKPAGRVNHHFIERNIPDNIKMIYAQNIDVLSSKIKPIPIGLENPGWHPGNMDLLKREMEKRIAKPYMLYINHSTSTNPPERLEPYELFKGLSWATCRHGKNGEDYPRFLRELNAHKFCLCPEGNGLDTHRLWETLYLGSIPITKKRIFTQEFSRILPIVVVDSWKQVTYQFLEHAWVEMRDRSREALAFSWWEKCIK